MAEKKSNPVTVLILCSILFGLLVVMPGLLAINYYLHRAPAGSIKKEIADKYDPIIEENDRRIEELKAKSKRNMETLDRFKSGLNRFD